MKLARRGEDGTEDNLYVYLVTTMSVSEAGATVQEVRADYSECV